MKYYYKEDKVQSYGQDSLLYPQDISMKVKMHMMH